ncbi:methyltransferase [Lachnospiraceae bacterium KK002]
MVKEQYESLKTGKNLRKDLIALKQELKQEESRQELLDILQGEYNFLLDLLHHEDGKVRGNAAMVLGRLKQDAFAAPLYEAYEKESKLFVKSSYLFALSELDISSHRSGLEERLNRLEQYKPAEEEEKHIREELKALRNLLHTGQNHPKHRFRGYDETYELILTTGSLYQKITASQVHGGKITILKSGVRVATSQIRPILKIPTYGELLFPLNTGKVEPEPRQAARALAQSNLLELLDRAHKAEDSYYFRLGVHSRMPLDKRSDFAKKCAFALEQETGRRLYNSTSDYEVEIRLMERKDGTFLPLVKLYTFGENRFAYRKRTVAASIRPEQAALIMRLAEPYLEKHAQILDPFCGVGTMLIERDRLCPARVMYGIDMFGEAIDGARENTALAGKNVNYIQRDFFAFQHDYLFDEIVTNMPDRGKKTREEQDLFYRDFFAKAQEVLTGQGRIILYSNEKNYVKKQLRLRKEFVLLQEYGMDEKGIYNLFIIGKRDWNRL